MKSFIKKRFKQDLNNEDGSVVIILLVIFFVMSMFFLGLYHIVLSDYLKSANGISNQSEFNKQSNLVETISPNYKGDMLNDKEYEDMKLTYGFNENYNKHFKTEYNNYMYEFIKLNEEGTLETKNGKFGRFDWVKFKNYTDIEVESEDDVEIIGNKEDSESIGEDSSEIQQTVREYIIADNWKATGKEKEKYYVDGKLLVRVPIYVKIDFANDVHSLKLEIGNDFDTKEYEFINRPQSDNIYKLEDIPYGSAFINLTSEEELNSTSISLLRGREIDVVVCKNNPKTVNNKCLEVVENLDDDTTKIKYFNKVLTKTLNMELGKMNNYIYFD